MSAKFRLWKQQGYLHCHGAGMDCPLALPVFMSDGCGYPALSFVLRAWVERDNERWHMLKQYLAASATGSQLELAALKPLALDSDEKLDTRFNTDCLGEWVFVLQPCTLTDAWAGVLPQCGRHVCQV